LLFSDAPGVAKGTPVRKSGVRIGEVDAVELDDENGTVRVRIAVDPKYILRDNEQPVIIPDLLSRDTTIDFMPKPKPETRPKPQPKAQSKASGVVPAQFQVAQAEPAPPPEPPLGKPVPPGSVIQGVVPPDIRQVL